MKGILFVGDSFTWGQGLQYYSSLPNIKINDNSFNYLSLTESHIAYIKKNRFPRLVADHFNTFELVKNENGGGMESIFKFLDNLETFKNSNIALVKPYSYNDFDYVVFQCTEIFRDRSLFYDTNKNEKYADSFNNQSDEYNELWKYVIDNYGSNIDNYIKDYPNILFKKIESVLKEIENNGIKTFITTWPKINVDYINNSEFLKERLITYNLNDTLVTSFEEFEHTKYGETQCGYTIQSDNIEIIGPNIRDGHLSKLGHKLVANAIIKKIEEYEQSTIHTI
jgi:hypothetical protein